MNEHTLFVGFYVPVASEIGGSVGAALLFVLGQPACQ
jgi:hypothetical protein